MKTRNYVGFLAVGAAALALHLTTGAAQSLDSVESLNNRAVSASPRAIEVFPWLARPSLPPAEVRIIDNDLAALRRNRAYSVSPRALEQFPELARSTPLLQREFTIAPLAEGNTAVLSSPRTREEYPILSRSETGTARGGASKLMEFDR
jgi:hypothetical protein